MATLAQTMLDAAIDLSKKQNGISEKDLEAIIDGVMKGGISSETFGSLENLQRFQKEEDGRTWNNTSTTYFLPSEKPEWVRLDKQHAAVCLGLGGLNPLPELVQDLLKPEPGVSKSVLDIGCGTGVWALEMARAFPSVNIVGVDLVPIPVEKEKLPSNFQMKIVDMNSELSQFQGQFDLVNMRFMTGGMTDVRKTTKAAQECLRFGGLFVSMSPDLRVPDSDQHTVLPMATDENPDGSWLQRMQYEVRHAIRLGGTDKLGQTDFIDGGYWDSELMDHTTCGTASLFLPISPWTTSSDQAEDIRLKLIGTLNMQNHMGVHRSWHTILKKSGLKQEELDKWSTNVDNDFIEKKFKAWFRIRIGWGRRRATLDQDHPPFSTQYIYKSIPLQLVSDKPFSAIGSASLQKSSTGQSDGTGTIFQLEVYETKEESLERSRGMVDPNPPLATRLTSQSTGQ